MIAKFSFIIICFLLKDVDCVEVLAEVGSEAILPCKSSPQTVSPAVTWSNSKGSIWKMLRSGLRFWKLNTAPRVSCPHKQFHRGDYNLHIRNVTEEDGGLYSCILELHNFRRPVITRVTLRVIKMTISPAAPVMGQSVSIRCSVSGGEEPRVRWMLNGSPYEEKKTYSGRIPVVGEALRIKASENLRGNWTCLVRSQGNEARATALLDVKGIIQPPSDDTQIYATVGSAVTLPCVFSKGLTPSSVLWERLQNKTTSKSSQRNLPPSFSKPSPLGSTEDRTASLNEVSFENAGRYRCSATVQGQRVERIMQLVTAKVEVEVSSKEDTTVKLTCRLSDSSAITGYEWIYTTFDLNGTEFTASVQKDQTVTLSQPSSGLWTCRFYGQQGLLGNVTHHFQHMERQTEDMLDSASHGAALILVGLLLLIIILLLVLSQMYKNYQRRKRLLQFPALETILHNKSMEQEMNERCQTQK